MRDTKVAVIGGGSPGWTPRLVTDIMLERELGGEIVLTDVDADALAVLAKVCERIRTEHSGRFAIASTTNLDEALDGADFVVVTITTGGLKAMRVDLEVPEKYHCFQTVGDTVGPGGLSRALRNIPVFVGFAQAMERRCPKAWMLNVSNPLTALTRTVEKVSSIRALGICHGVDGAAHDYAKLANAEGAKSIRFAGVDHCSWLLDLRVGDTDVLAEIRARLADGWRFDEDKKGILEGYVACLKLYENLGYLPAIQARHIVEFFPYFLRDMEQVERYGLRRTSIADRERGRQKQVERARRQAAGEEDIPRTQSNEAVAPAIRAMVTGKRVVVSVNARNEGQIPNLPLGAVVETLCVIDGAGVHAATAGPLPPEILAVVLPHVLRQEMTVEAGLSGDRDKALTILATDPLVQDLDSAKDMLDEMLEANRKWLPQFFPGKGKRAKRT
jgi:alpha-galactosidase/6-phospho-beta-glucosidase family protein